MSEGSGLIHEVLVDATGRACHASRAMDANTTRAAEPPVTSSRCATPAAQPTVAWPTLRRTPPETHARREVTPVVLHCANFCAGIAQCAHMHPHLCRFLAECRTEWMISSRCAIAYLNSPNCPSRATCGSWPALMFGSCLTGCSLAQQRRPRKRRW